MSEVNVFKDSSFCDTIHNIECIPNPQTWLGVSFFSFIILLLNPGHLHSPQSLVCFIMLLAANSRISPPLTLTT